MEDEISGGKQSICSSGENYGRISSGKLTPEAQNAKPNLSVSDDGGHPQQQDDAADVRNGVKQRMPENGMRPWM